MNGPKYQVKFESLSTTGHARVRNILATWAPLALDISIRITAHRMATYLSSRYLFRGCLTPRTKIKGTESSLRFRLVRWIDTPWENRSFGSHLVTGHFKHAIESRSAGVPFIKWRRTVIGCAKGRRHNLRTYQWLTSKAAKRGPRRMVSKRKAVC